MRNDWQRKIESDVAAAAQNKASLREFFMTRKSSRYAMEIYEYLYRIKKYNIRNIIYEYMCT